MAVAVSGSSQASQEIYRRMCLRVAGADGL